MTRYLNKETGAIYDSLQEAQEKLGIRGYIEAIERGILIKAVVIK